MTNIFYQLPIRSLNIIVGIGTGTTEYDCTVCSTYYEKGSATQWYTSFGMFLISSLEIHLSYRSVTSKNIKNKGDRNQFLSVKLHEYITSAWEGS